ncbi:tRNA (adenosine(37)-N6)-threonylcarbamoyltransferase complex dimerization subunit type 1 TsaB [Alkalinema pantanalense CENA528]|uniref:tRNA (adenosine(37)-N6)-threonylcarbamoyltransferase complex dimerization subunit type 1 TsaB n=1 Tax=Alkalinema pantanalense TaxID=1620705 RepID=UPI003D6EA639
MNNSANSQSQPVSQKSYGLAIHTSSPTLGFAIASVHDRQSMRCQSWDLGREVSSLLHQYLADFIAPQTWSDLAFIAVAKGPGGFTGTRLGVVAARTLAQQLNIPLFGISSLAAIAWANGIPTEPIAVQMPAQRGELHTGIFQWSSEQPEETLDKNFTKALKLTVVQTESVCQPEVWEKTLRASPGNYCVIEAPTAQGQYASAVLELAQQMWSQGLRPHWSETLPIYGQHPVDR